MHFRGLSCSFSLLFGSVVLGCQYSSYATGPYGQWCHCTYAPSLLCSTCAVCSCTAHTLCFGCSLVYLSAFSLRIDRRTILVTLYSMVWDRFVSRSGITFFIGLRCSNFFVFCCFPFLFFYFYGLVLYGWGLRTDRVSIALSRACFSYQF